MQRAQPALTLQPKGFPGQHPSPRVGSPFPFHISAHRPFTVKSLQVNEFYIPAHFMVLLLLFNLMFINIFVYLIFANIPLYEYANFIHFTGQDFSCFQSLFRSQFLIQCFHCKEANTGLAKAGMAHTSPQLLLSTGLLLSLNLWRMSARGSDCRWWFSFFFHFSSSTLDISCLLASCL